MAEPDSPEFDHTALDRILSVLSPEPEEPQSGFIPPALAVAPPLSGSPFHGTPPSLGVINSPFACASPNFNPLTLSSPASQQINSGTSLLPPSFTNPDIARPFAPSVLSPSTVGISSLLTTGKVGVESSLPSTPSQISSPRPMSLTPSTIDVPVPVPSALVAPPSTINQSLEQEAVATQPSPTPADPTSPEGNKLSSLDEAPSTLVKPSQSPATSVPELQTKISFTTATASVTTTSVLTVTTSTTTSTSKSRPAAAIPALRLAALSPNIKSSVRSTKASIFDMDEDMDEKVVPDEHDKEFVPGNAVVEKKKRGRKRKPSSSGSNTPSIKIKLKTPAPCDHKSVEKENDDDKGEDLKNLSRSFSSIKQRLKMLAKDMTTPVARPAIREPPATPLTLKIKRSEDGRWSSNSTPTSGKLVLKISNGRSSMTTPRIRVKPIKKAKTEVVPRLKISVGRPKGRRSATPSRLEATPKSSYVPEGWVSFDQVQTKLTDLPANHNDKVEIIDAKKKPKEGLEELPKVSDDVQVIKSTSVPEHKRIELKQDNLSLGSLKAKTVREKPSPDIEISSISLLNNDKPSFGSDESLQSSDKPLQSSDKPLQQSSDKPLQSSDKPLQSSDKPLQSSDKPSPGSFKPKISLRTDLFAIKSENPSPSPKVRVTGCPRQLSSIF